MESTEIQEIIDLLARQNLMAKASAVSIFDSTKVYEIPAGMWEAQAAREEPGAAEAMDSIELERTIANPGIGVIFIPAIAAINQAIIERSCKRSSLPKIIFRERDRQ